MVYFVIETQVNDGVGAVIPLAFTDRSQAEAKYHQLLSVAAVSEIDKHGVMLCNEDLFVIKSEVYNHEAEE